MKKILLYQHLGCLEAEAKAYELGIMFAKDMRFHEIALEGDSVMRSEERRVGKEC